MNKYGYRTHLAFRVSTVKTWNKRHLIIIKQCLIYAHCPNKVSNWVYQCIFVCKEITNILNVVSSTKVTFFRNGHVNRVSWATKNPHWILEYNTQYWRNWMYMECME